jgi:hypothetical protein
VEKRSFQLTDSAVKFATLILRMKVKLLFIIALGLCFNVDAQQLVFPEGTSWKTVLEGEKLAFRVMVADSLAPKSFSVEGAENTGIQLDSLGNFSWVPGFDLVDRLQKQKDFSVIVQADWANGKKARTPVTFTVFHKNRPPVVEDLPVFYVRQGVNRYQISPDYVSDPDGDPMVFKPIQSQMPEGASLSASGLLTWTPSRGQFNALKNTPITISFSVEDQPEKAETTGKIKVAQTQLDLPPEIYIVPGDTAITMKEDALLNFKIYVNDPNGDDEVRGIDFISSDSRIPKNSLHINTNTQAEFTWTPGYYFTDEAEKVKTVELILFAIDKANNRVQRKLNVSVEDAENLVEKDKQLYQKYRNTLVLAKSMIDVLDVNRDKLNKSYKQAKKGKRQRSIVNVSLGTTAAVSPLAWPQDSKAVASVSGAAVAGLGALETGNVIGKSVTDIVDKQKINVEIRNQLQGEGDNFARKYSLKSNRRLKEFDSDREKLLPIVNDQRLLMLELDASKPNPKYDDKDLKKTFTDFSEE